MEDVLISENDSELAAMQVKQLELLKELDRVCKIVGAKYYLSSGTCLGALRHQGFIPWDDDIDVYMYWRDAEKLLNHSDVFREKFFLQCKKTDPDIKTTHYRLRDSSTSIFLEEDKNLNCNHGIFIDIYILYPYPDKVLYAKKLIFDSFIYRILVAGDGPQNHGKIAKILGKGINILYRGKRAKNKINSIENEYRYNGGKRYLATYFGRDVSFFHSIIYPRIWFTQPVQLNFEDMIVNCPGNVHEYCKKQYGDTYMDLPPKEKQIPHHDYIFRSVDEPYTKYKGIYY